MSKFLSRFVREEAGASMVEYGLLLALIAVVAMAAVQAVGGKVSGTFSGVDSQMGS